jgi:phosphoribosylamine--glycine ligase
MFFMEKYGIRAGGRKRFTDIEKALEYTEQYFGRGKNQPLVIKADGLASGKGVVITADLTEAKETLSAFIKEGVLGEAGKSVNIEEYLDGVEVSVMAAVSVTPNVSSGGNHGVIKPFIPARDHKRRFEGGMGPNTGGMGAIAPVPDFTPFLQKDFENAILLPTLKGMEAEKMDYRGFIFFGLMVQEGRCYLLEYNVRLGDPETQALLPLMDSDFPELCLSILEGRLDSFNLKWKNEAACAPVAVAQGYPGSYRKGEAITINPQGLKQLEAKLFIAGAQRTATGLQTSGGRVLSVCALGANAEEARIKAYEALDFINFEGMSYRKDIGLDKKHG